MIAVHESALESIKAMGQRDKDEIDRLRHVIKTSQEYATSIGSFGHAKYLHAHLMVNTYSTAIIQKAE